MYIFHITDQTTWEADKNDLTYEGDTLSSEGFIHCCFRQQIERVLLNWFEGKNNLVVLEIDPEKIRSLIKYENLNGGEETYPHIYGPINIDAVVSVIPIVKGKTDETRIE
jgi:uncharacterized protein (DUF952 family)